MSYDYFRAAMDYNRLQQENERRMREMQERENQRRYEETQREMQRRDEEARRQWMEEQRVTNLILQQSHDTTSYSSSTSYYVSESERKQRQANIKAAPAMCKPYEDRLLALIEQKYIELRAEHDKFRAEFLAKNPGQEMRCKPLMDRETSFLGITIKPADRDKWYSIIGGEYLRSLKRVDTNKLLGKDFGSHVRTYTSIDGKIQYKLTQRGTECTICECCKRSFRTEFNKYDIPCDRSPLYENGKNRRAPLSNEVSQQSPNFTIVNGQIVRTQPTFQPLPPNLRTYTFYQEDYKIWNINYDSIDGVFTTNKMREIYRA